MWILWLVFAALLIAGEVLTTGFFLLWFGVGAAVAAVAALIGISSLPAQIFIFLLVSILLLIASRTIFEKYLMRGTAPIRTGIETMIGETVQVVEASQGTRNEAAVKAFGSVWTAIPIEGEPPLAVGDTVKIDRVDGTTVYVYRPTHHPFPHRSLSSE